jgi:hypothetical protein
MSTVLILSVAIHDIMQSVIMLSFMIFEHFAIIPDPVTEFLILGSALHKQGTILAPKQADLLSHLIKRIRPFYLDRVSSLNLDPVNMIRIHVLFVLYKQVN